MIEINKDFGTDYTLNALLHKIGGKWSKVQHMMITPKWRFW